MALLKKLSILGSLALHAVALGAAWGTFVSFASESAPAHMEAFLASAASRDQARPLDRPAPEKPREFEPPPPQPPGAPSPEPALPEPRPAAAPVSPLEITKHPDLGLWRLRTKRAPQPTSTAAPTASESTPERDRTATDRELAPTLEEVVDGLALVEHGPPPRYPRGAWRLHLEGTVILLAQVAPSGRVVAVEVEQSSGHPVLDRAAIRALEGWRFRARSGAAGRRGTYRARVPFAFRVTR